MKTIFIQHGCKKCFSFFFCNLNENQPQYHYNMFTASLYLIFVTNITNSMGYVEKNLSCGRGEISDFYTKHMWRNMKFFHLFHVQIFQISFNEKEEFRNYSTCGTHVFFAIYAILVANLFCRDLHFLY